MWVLDYEVHGKGIFPFDMLRYDSSIPSSTDDAVALAPFDPALSVRTIKLTKLSAYKSGGPTNMRWLSFGWKVTKVGIPRNVRY